MRIQWSKPTRIEQFIADWDLMPSTAGVYVISTSVPIQRIGGVDPSGVLYVGRASNLRARIWKFSRASHTASGFLWTHPSIARLVIGNTIRSVGDVERHLSKLLVRYATPIGSSKLSEAERALLFSYINTFGEAPPLNLSLSKRWDSIPSAQDLRWAEVGIFERPQ